MFSRVLPANHEKERRANVKRQLECTRVDAVVVFQAKTIPGKVAVRRDFINLQFPSFYNLKILHFCIETYIDQLRYWNF